MVETRTRKILGYLRLIATGLFITALTLVFMEGLASYALSFRDRITTYVGAELERSMYDPDLGWVSKPNIHIADMFGPGRYIRTNSQGFRNNHDFDRIVAEGQLRIVCSGDSFTFGAGVDNDHTWCQLLESLDPRFETLNMGQSGYGVDQAYLSYKRDGLRFSHQVHLLAFITDDFYRMQSVVFLEYPKPVLEVENGRLVVTNVPVPRRSDYFSRLARQVRTPNRLRTVEFSKRVVQKIRVGAADDIGRVQEAKDKKTREVLRKIFEDLKNLSEERSIQLVLVYLPSLPELMGENPDWSHGIDTWKEWLEFLKSESNALGIPLFDVLSDFRRLPAHEVVSMYIAQGQPGAGHFNDQGNAFVARLIYEKLRPSAK